MTRRAAKRKPKPKRIDWIDKLTAEVTALGEHVIAMRRELHNAITPRPELVDNDPPIGVVAAAELSGKSAKVLRALIDKGEPIGEYHAANDRYLVRMRALSEYLKRR
jgi:hypothetical protein